MSADSPLRKWAMWLRNVAELSPAAPDRTVPFSDEAGHRRDVDEPFLAWRSTRNVGIGFVARPVTDRGRTPDVMLWRALTDDAIDPVEVIKQFDGPRQNFDSGSLFPASDLSALEVWTEVELSSLHALWWLACRRALPELGAMARRVALWHVDNVQPDNATNHPWGLPVFIELAERHANVNARHLAQTLVHNAQVTLGRPDRLSAEILRDAADACDEMAG